MTFLVKLMNHGDVYVRIVHSADENQDQFVRPGDSAELLAIADGDTMALSTFTPEPPAGLPPVLTTLTGNASIDDSPADGVSANAATFTAQDQYGGPMSVSLDVASDIGTVSAATITTDADTGTGTVNVTSTTAGPVSVSAVTMKLRADVKTTFTDVVKKKRSAS